MSKLLESSASRIIAETQRIGCNVDPEVLSWPGGYFIAASVCLYAGAAVFTRGFIERRGRRNSCAWRGAFLVHEVVRPTAMRSLLECRGRHW